MSFETTPPKFEQIEESAKQQREENIAKHVAQLIDLQEKIKAANSELEAVTKDIAKVHADRLAQYGLQENTINQLKADLKNQQESIEKQRLDMEERSKTLDAHHTEAVQSLNSKEIGLRAKEDQMQALQKELDEITVKAAEVANAQKETQEEHVKRKIELDEATTHCNELQDLLNDRVEQYKRDVAAHQVNVDAHIEREASLAKDQQKNLDFYNAVIAREANIEPSKKKYEDGIEANAKEAKRLQDQNIESFRIKKDAEDRLKRAGDVEARIIAQTAKLEELKESLSQQIKEQETKNV